MTPRAPAPGPSLRSADGSDLATWDLGGDGPALVIFHATGFHGRSYAPLAGALADSFHCFAVDQRGHGASARAAGGDYRWSKMADDVAAALETLGLYRPFAFGHSLGGGLAAMAESRRPGSFAALWLFEPIIFPARFFPDDPEHGLVGISRRRRRRFDSLGDALFNYASKPPFDRFRADALWHYVSGGLEPNGDAGVGLHLSPHDEAETFAGARHSGSYDAMMAVTAPTTLACGTIDPVTPPVFLTEVAQTLAHGRAEVTDGLSHFGPFENPDAVAASIKEALGGRKANPSVRETVTPPR